MAAETINITDANVVEEIRNAIPNGRMTKKGLFGGVNAFLCREPDVDEDLTTAIKKPGFKEVLKAEPKSGYCLEITFAGANNWLEVLAYEDGDIFVRAGGVNDTTSAEWRKISFTI